MYRYQQNSLQYMIVLVSVSLNKWVDISIAIGVRENIGISAALLLVY